MILRDEIDLFISEFRTQIKEILATVDDENDQLGDIGEYFVQQGILFSMWDNDYHLSCDNESSSFSFISKDESDDEDGSADFCLRFTSPSGANYRCFIESKNWGRDYRISPSLFNREILSRFLRSDRNGKDIWIVTMNRRKICYIIDLCQAHDIHIITMNECLTPEGLTDEDISECMIRFINEFTNLIKTICPVTTNNSLDNNKSKKQMIMNDIRLGIPYNKIQKKYNTSLSYIMKIASQMRRNSERINDRRKKDWLRLLDKYDRRKKKR